ncbi:hypothetical protein [Marinobacter sp. W-8]|uniref:hypothetical protein n=1 Tax=Marinobacter sp. W-8 TaxID=3369658 RepID=UPI0037CAA747
MIDVVLSGLVTGLIGLVAGNQMALGRDRRKEFNEATEPLRDKLRGHIQSLERRVVVSALPENDLSVIVRKLGERRSAAIVTHFNRYTATVKKNVSPGSPFHAGVVTSPRGWDELISDAQKLYEAVQPK